MTKVEAIMVAALCSLFASLLTALLVHWLQAKRDVENKKREKVTDYLIEAYTKLEYAANRAPTEKTKDSIEFALGQIQLFGNADQVVEAAVVARSFSEDSRANLLDLLQSLRKSLRRELRLRQISKKLEFFRFTRQNSIVKSK